MRNVFLRAQQMMAEISGVKVVCRGVVHCLKEDKTALQAETETFGGAMKPLYVYFGDGKVLCGAENARLTAGGETFRVLKSWKSTSARSARAAVPVPVCTPPTA